MNTEQHFKARIIMFICGIASSVPWVLSLCTPFSVGFLTIAMNLLFVAVQPILLRAFYWRELMGQVIVTIPFGNSIDFFMWVLQDYNPDTLLERWIAYSRLRRIFGSAC